MADVQATDFDNPATPAVDESVDVTNNGLVIKKLTVAESETSGTGTYTPFLNQNATGQAVASQGFNTDDGAAKASNNGAGLDMSNTNSTQAIQLKEVPIVYINGIPYYEFRLDINEENNSNLDAGGQPNPLLALSELQIYTSDRQAVLADYNASSYETRALGTDNNGDFQLVYDLDEIGDNKIILRDTNSGSGADDYVFYVPVSRFDGADPNSYVTFFSQFGPSPAEGATFEEWRIQSPSSIEGIKFADINGDGIRDANGVDNITGTADDEVGLGGFVIYVDANNNNQLDDGEISTITGPDGTFVLNGFLGGTTGKDYVIREAMTGQQLNNYILTTGNAEGDHVVTITGNGVYTLAIGNKPIIKDFTIDKSVVSIVDGPDAGAGTGLDGAGDKINYLVSITNTGNVALTNVNVSDLLEGAVGLTLTLASSGNGDAVFDVGETWTYTTSYTITQGDLDGKGGGNGLLDNVATATAKYNGETIGPKNDSTATPLVYNPAILVTKDVDAVDAADNQLADKAGDIIDYTIKIANTGNITLTGVEVTDAVEAYGATAAAYVSGDTDGDGKLDVGETWVYDAKYELTQDDLDGKGGGDGKLDNLGVGDTDQTGSDDDSETVDLVYNPAILVTKDVDAVDAADNQLADKAGDIIDYTIKIANTGNITLTGVEVTDAVEAYGATAAAYVSGDTDGDGKLDVGETWVYDAKYELTQDDLDGKGGGDGKLDNLGVGDTDQTGSDDDSETVDLVYNPAILVTKDVDAVDAADNQLADKAGDIIDYTIKIANTGNITLTGVEVTDAVEAYGATAAAYVSGDTDGDGKLDVGETWVYDAKYELTQDDLDGKGGGDGKLDNLGVGDTDQTGSDDDSETVDLVYNPAILVTKDVDAVDAADNQLADKAGDIIDYTIKIANTGNITLTGVEVTDAVEAYGATAAAYVSGDTDGDGKLDVGETWVYDAKYELTQDDLDGKGGGDGKLDNLGVGDTDQTGSDDDSETVDLVYNPNFTVVKAVTGITGDGNANGKVDTAGGVISYSITVANTGNITLTGYVLSDPNATTLTGPSGDTDGDGNLDVGETWAYTATHVVTQAELNGKGTGIAGTIDGDGDTDNRVTVTTSEAGTKFSEVKTDLDYNPAIDLEKFVSVDGGQTYDDADMADGLENVNIGAPVSFMITVTNMGNISLTNVNITDINKTEGLPGVPINLGGVTVSESGVVNGILDVGETWTLKYTQPFDAGVHLNTASVTTAQGVSDSDDAYYYSLVNQGPGVRTPGFWSNLGFKFWDGVAGNEPKQAGTPGFAKGELLYGVDTNGDGTAGGPGDKVGLLVGDYNFNGKTDVGEDTLFIELKDAQTLINASNKNMSDGVYKLGRDVVATWLNNLAGNNIGDASDSESPKHYLDDAIDWLQKFAGTTNMADESKDVFKFGAAVKTNAASWSSPNAPIDHSASDLHDALDHYNNDGTTEDGGKVYAHDSDSSMFITALTIAKTAPAMFVSSYSGEDASHMLAQQQFIA